MKLIAIDSSGLVASVAILIDQNIVAEYSTNFKKTHSQTLLPMLDDIVKMVGFKLEEVDAIVVSNGPGSFTGLRIGSATAKGLALALKKPIIAVPTLEGLAYNIYGTDQLVCPIMDAKRQQVYTAVFEYKENELEICMEQKAVAIDELLSSLKDMNRKVIFLGDGVEVYREKIVEVLGTQADFAPAHLSKQRAASVAALGAKYFENGKIQDAKEHVPVYLRKSQAERELEEKQKAAKKQDE